MAPLHRVYFLGTVIQAPAVWVAPNGTTVAGWSLAVPTRQRQGDTGHADVCRIEVRAFGYQAAIVEATLRPGCTVLIEGRVQWWRTAQGSRSRNTQAVIAERIQCLSCPRQTPCAAACGGTTRCDDWSAAHDQHPASLYPAAVQHRSRGVCAHADDSA